MLAFRVEVLVCIGVNMVSLDQIGQMGSWKKINVCIVVDSGKSSVLEVKYSSLSLPYFWRSFFGCVPKSWQGSHTLPNIIGYVWYLNVIGLTYIYLCFEVTKRFVLYCTRDIDFMFSAGMLSDEILSFISGRNMTLMVEISKGFWQWNAYGGD